MTELERRIIEISYKQKLAHIGSCLTAVAIIDGIFKVKLPSEKFVLSAGHAGLALYTVIEKYYKVDAESLFHKCGVHPDRLRSPEFIDCSTGSLGLGLPIALGMALADRSKKVYCLVSDGECAEGSIYESLNIKERKCVDNLIVFCNYNGWSAYGNSIPIQLKRLPGIVLVDTSEHWFIEKYKQEAHYKVLNSVEYEEAICR